nr:TetR/AcrR family transcriptional regulator [Pelosinus baikalensis]
MSCAESLVFQKGLQGWNMDQLAAKAGLAKNTLYKIITSKEILLEKVIINKIKDLQWEVGQIIEKEAEYFAALDQILLVFPKIVGLYSDTFREVYNEYPAIEEQIICHRRELTQYIYQFIQKGKDAGKLHSEVDPETLIQTLQAVLLYFIKQEPDAVSFQQKLKISFGYILKGIQK